MAIHRTTFALFALVFGAVPAVATHEKGVAQGRTLTPEDYYEMKIVSDPRLSPDGTHVAYVVTTFDRERNRKSSAVWVSSFDPDGTSLEVADDGSPNHPRWSPDGRTLAFIARPAPYVVRPQIYAVALGSVEAHRLSEFPNGVDDFEWSPDGLKLACVSKTPNHDNQGSQSFKHYIQPQLKLDGRGYLNGKVSHIFVRDVRSNTVRQITYSEDRDDVDPSWSPDGSRIAFIGESTDRGSARTSELLLGSSEGGEITKLSSEASSEISPRWSPDGRWIGYIAAGSPGAMPRIWVVASLGGRAALASKNLDLVPSSLEWSESGRSLDAVVRVRGEAQVYRIELSTGKAEAMTSGAHWIQELNVNIGSNRAAFVTSDERHLGEIYVSDLSYRNERRITHENDELLREVELQPAERLTYKGADGWDIDGFLIKPYGWSPGKKYPLIVSVHGGPSGMYGFRSDDEMQVYAGKSWAVFYTNPRGSSGYGEKFQRGVEREWGGKAYEDIMKGVESVLAKNPWIDREHMAIRGQSYGGFMTNWVVGHTNIFKAACTVSGISDFISLEGVRDTYYGHASDFGGDLFQNFDLYWKYSPLQYARDVRTPTLILHGEADQHVPLEQAEEWFRALKHFGVDSELVIFPREDHSMPREPRHIVDLMRWQIYWFEQFLNGNPKATPPDRE